MSKQLKICILCEYLSYVGGGERVYCSWANMLATELKHDVTIVSLEDWDKPFYHLDSSIRINSLKLRNPKFYLNPRRRRLSMLVNYFGDIKTISRYLHENDYDVVISIAVNMNLILANISGNFLKIATEHSEYHAPNNWIRYVRNKLYRKFDLLTVLNKFDQVQFKRYNPNTLVLPNPVDTLNERGLPADLNSNTLISIGSLSPQKNQSDMIDIMNIIHEKYPDWKLKIYGEGPLRDVLSDKIRQTNSVEYISLEGVTKNVNEVLSNASIFILTSKIEGFGLVLIEAMGKGLPCVSYKAYGPDSIISEGVNGFLINQHDKKEFANKIMLLIEKKQLRKNMGNNAYESVEPYLPSKIAQLWSKILVNDTKHIDS